jgi:hypothetical protein
MAERGRRHREDHFGYDGDWQHPNEIGFDYWCVAHDERDDCHSYDAEGSCNPDCPDCPVRCPWCAKRMAP